ncbi:MAG TPA: DUF4214 domain-containing protein [Pirellulales bacterium]|nr:DUF4214 domain-containing protein [Pirellulales bacterium]
MLIAGGADTAGSVEMQFVDDLFQEVLHRSANSADVSYFLNQVDAGVPFPTIIDNFLNSSEVHADQVTDDFTTYLGRSPDAAGAAYWQNQLDDGLPEDQFIVSLIASPEYYANHGSTDSGFVTGLYQDVLGRSASPAEVSYWDNQLAGGATRSVVAAAFVDSAEHLDTVIEGYYQDYLNQSADPGGLAYWQSNLAGGGSVVDFEQQLLLARLGPGHYQYTLPQAGGLSADDVQQLLNRAQAASSRQDAIIAVVDRNGNILGVRTEAGVQSMYAGRPDDLVFAIDGAVSLARSGALFSSDQGALTSRTVRFLSQTTITEREVDSNPNVTDLNSPVRGPGFVAPIGLGAHFPPNINNTPPVDLFDIEATNRDSLLHPDANGEKYAGDPGMVQLPSRFNVPTQYIPPGQDVAAPESYGYVSGVDTYAQSRGIATLPGGVPIYKNINGQQELVGGIGVFFPGPQGYASFEEGYVNGAGQSDTQLTNAPLVLEAEWMAFAAAADDFAPTATVNGVGPVPGVGYGLLYQEQINLAGVQVETFGPNPTTGQVGGIPELLQVGATSGASIPTPAFDQPIDTGGQLYAASRPVPSGWIVVPHDSPTGELSAADVTQIISQGIAEAQQVRSAIREAPIPGDVNLSPGPRAEMVFSVTDEEGNVLGLYRMPDSTVFSLDVAVAKARNVSYFSNADQLQPIDELDPATGTLVLPPGAAYTNRTFRYLADPRFPDGINGTPPGPFSILWDPGTNPTNGDDTDPANPVPASAFQSVMGYDAFHPQTNFRDKSTPVANQNGVVFFPGSAPLYKNGVLVGGLGVSGDGTDQDDDVTSVGTTGYGVPANTASADDIFVRGVRLPYQNFNRNPTG